MKIIKNLGNFVILKSQPIMAALEKINSNKHRLVFAVDDDGIYSGVLTDGDFRRWLIQSGRPDLNQSLEVALNIQSTTASVDAPLAKVEELFREGIEAIPLLDNKGRLKSIVLKQLSEISIENKFIGTDAASFIIAEIGNNHNGCVKRAKELVIAAKEAGADCAKFQMRHMKSLYGGHGSVGATSFDLGTEYTLDLLNKFNLRPEELFEIFDFCKQIDIIPLCTPWDHLSLEALEEYGLSGYKVASADLTNHDLLLSLCKTGKPLLLSTGMSTEAEIVESLNLLKSQGTQYVLLLCNSTYPTPFKDINLSYLNRLKELGDGLVGYSGHERGIHVPIAAVSLGAKVIEKHFTFDKNLEGNDHKVSLLPEEFALMVRSIRDVEAAMGNNRPRSLSQGEKLNRESLAKSLYATRNISKGEIIEESMLEARSPGIGLQPNRKKVLLGIPAKRNLAAGDPLFESDLLHGSQEARSFNFQRVWGIPVRFHDLEKLAANSNPQLVEFHLSYRDLELDPSQFLIKTYPTELVIHAPELFENDHLLDLASSDENYRNISIAHLKRVVSFTNSIMPYFPSEKKIRIIVNCGGFTLHDSMKHSDKKALYDRVFDALAQCSQPSVEFLPQTMPPYPWHFGGQSFHNIFIDGAEIENFCVEHNYRICLDIAHSKLACNTFGWSFHKFVERIGPFVSHLHIVDAAGTSDEGLQIGEGEIDFPALASQLLTHAPKASFIPEIWQGHKNNGEGFWTALSRLEGLL